MIGTPLTPTPGIGSRRYAGAMASLWGRLSLSVRSLETLAQDRDRLEDGAAALPALQYELHWASELLVGVEPPEGGEVAHAELAAALVEARDLTGDVSEALETGGVEAAAMLLHEWRGALFRLRLARSRLPARPVAEAQSPEAFPRAAAAATLLIVSGVAAFAAGSVAAV